MCGGVEGSQKKVVYHSWLMFSFKLGFLPDNRFKDACPGFSIAYASRRGASEGEATSSSGHRLVPPKKSVEEFGSIEYKFQ